MENLEIPDRIKKDYIDEGITELNPPQRKAVNSGLMDGDDMIVASPTASGKTFIAELAMVNQVVKQEKTAVYIVPLKALASEKYQDFSERYENLNVRISVGDLDDEGKGLDNADIVVTTSEKLDSMLRHNPSWIHNIGLVVTDEIHLLTSPERGPTLEVTLTRLRELLDFQMLGLSATISNSSELATWLDAELVESSYRPVDLEHGVYWQNEVEFFTGDEEIDEEDDSSAPEGFKTGAEVKKQEEKKDEGRTEFIDDVHGRGVTNIIEDTLEQEKQAIVFCNSRKGAEKSSDRAGKVTDNDIDYQERQELEEYADRIVNVLGSPTSQCKRLAENVRKGAAFHHAGLVTEQRNLVEEAFRKGLIRTVSATPTLAAGVNLPAFRVIIRDLKRYTGSGMDFIPVLEYEQMTGRAGRPKYDDRGEAISIAKNPGMKDEILNRYILGEPERIQSKLAVKPVLRMHTLALVASKFCTDMDELLSFYKKTFYAHQFEEMSEVEAQIKDVVDQLIDYGFLHEEELEATKVGRRVSELYIDPDSAHRMLQSLEKAQQKEAVKPVSYLFMLARTSEMNPPLRVKDKEWSDYEQMLMDARDYLLESIPNEWDVEYESFMNSMKTAAMMQAWIGENDEEKLMNEFNIAPGGIRAKMRNADWLVYAAKELARTEELDTDKDLEKLRIRLKHGIKEELLSLVKYDQIGRVRARKLHDNGVRDMEDIREVSFEKLKKLIGKRTAKKLKKQVGEENIFDRENIMDYFD
ncbi:ATP-dependent DNA helicase [Candidatus Nanohalovita haloferacivicina]|nr:ATP-dependent DNA helicase [Candidatus Nanohalobia archaeon BNXNv]